MKRYLVMLLALIALIGLRELRFRQLADELAREKARPPIVYQVDNAGGMTAVGVVTEKKEDGGEYSIAVNGYGWFHVDKEHYDMIEVGKKAPQFILDRGSR